MTIKGYATDQETAAAISESVGLACDARETPRFIAITPMPIYSGDHVGEMFIPLPDSALEQVLWRGIKMKDFPEFQELVTGLGGLEARVEINADDLIDPDAEVE